jgi:hypothetical protein
MMIECCQESVSSGVLLGLAAADKPPDVGADAVLAVGFPSPSRSAVVHRSLRGTATLSVWEAASR